MLRTPADDDPLAVDARVQTAGSFGATVAKAAEFAGLDGETTAVLRMAAAVVERHSSGFMPQDIAVGQLSAALTAFVAAMRDRYIAQQEGGQRAA